MFPPGLPGLALLLMRASVVASVLLEDYSHRHGLSGWLHGAAILIALALSVGHLTPVVAGLALAFHASIWFAHGVDDAFVAIIFSLDAIALALLGPGAYSLDSYRFGRRLVLPPP